MAHPPLLSKVPATKVVPISTQEQKIEKYKTPTVSLPGGQDLRARANSIANRRHTLIQYQLAAAKFNTSLRHTRREGYMEKQEPEQESLDFAWDEYVKAVASRRHSEASRTNKKAGRGLGRQLEALRMYMESRRSSQAAVNKPRCGVRRAGGPLREHAPALRLSLFYRNCSGTVSELYRNCIGTVSIFIAPLS